MQPFRMASIAFVVAVATGSVHGQPVDWACEVEELLASDGGIGDWFGYSVAVDGDLAVVGARLDDPNHPTWPWAGSAYVFRFDGARWVEQARLLASDPHNSAEFGWSVAISGDTIVVGTPQHTHFGIQCGAAYVFEPGANGVWDDGSVDQVAELLASDRASGAGFGGSVAIAGDHILVGAAGDNQNGSMAGAVYHFAKPPAGWQNMTETAKLLATDANGQYANDNFGHAVAMDGSLFGGYSAVIGAPYDSDSGSGAGAAYVFYLGASGWTQNGKLLASNGLAGDHFGWSVDVYDSFLPGACVVVGAPYYNDLVNGPDSGSAYFFCHSGIGGQPWTELAQAKPIAPNGNPFDHFGWSVAMSSMLKFVIGAPNDDDIAQNSGAAYVLWWDGSTWWQQDKVSACCDGAAQDSFGSTVALSGGTALVGAHQHDHGGQDGSVYVFDLYAVDCNSNGVCDSREIAFGTSEDCNLNGIPDDCDITGGTSLDCNANGIPDECELSIMPVDDHFDDGALDPAWSVTFDGATGWTYAEAGTMLTVTDISNPQVNTWAAVRLAQPLRAVGDVHVAFDFSWASQGSTMQQAWIALLDVSGATLAEGRFDDPWSATSGQRCADVSGSSWCSGPGSLPSSGSAVIDIERTAGTLTVKWDGAVLLSGVSTAAIESLEIGFSYYRWSGGPTFGTISVDRVWVPVPLLYDCNANSVPDDCDISSGTSADCNTNGIPDECELWGDLDGDGDVDLADYAGFEACLAGPAAGLGSGCLCCDANADADVDVADFAEFQVQFTG